MEWEEHPDQPASSPEPAARHTDPTQRHVDAPSRGPDVSGSPCSVLLRSGNQGCWSAAAALAPGVMVLPRHIGNELPESGHGDPNVSLRVVAYIGFGRIAPVLPGWLFGVYLTALIVAFMRRPSGGSGWFVTLALGLALPAFRQIRFKGVVQASHYLAQYSYGIYLAHPFALVVGMYALRGYAVWVQVLVELLVIAGGAVGAYHLLEEPMIRLGARLATRVESSPLLLVGTVD